MAYKFDKTFQGPSGLGSSGTLSAAQLESRNGVLYLRQDSVTIDESSRHNNKLGEGTFAKVYVGMHMGKERAIKVFRLRSNSTVDKAREEWVKLNSLKHPNIVSVYGMWEDPHKGRNAPAIVMELCGNSLHEYIQKYHPITCEHKPLKILYDITCAMVYLHSQNIVHGDLRTPNVLVKRINEVTAKLTDFGMARELDPLSNYHVTKSAADVGYLPPEVFNHEEQKDRKENWAKLTIQVDVFMFGPIAIELACGEFPKPIPKHEIRKGKVTRTYSEIERREQHLTKVNASNYAITDVIVKKCLAENPEDRGTFHDLQMIVTDCQWRNDLPDNFQELLEEPQEELDSLRSQLEADQVSLYQQDVEQRLEEEKEELKKENEQLIKARDYVEQSRKVEAEMKLEELCQHLRGKADCLESLCQEMGEKKKGLEEEISTLEDALSKDGQSRMLTEILESVKSKDSAQLQQKLHAADLELKDKDETIARKNKKIDELKRTDVEKNDLKEILLALRKEFAEAVKGHAIKKERDEAMQGRELVEEEKPKLLLLQEVGEGGEPAELEAKKLRSQLQDFQKQLDLKLNSLEKKKR